MSGKGMTIDDNQPVSALPNKDVSSFVSDVDMNKVDRWDKIKVLISACIGTTIEWYEFVLFGTMAPLIFDKQFYPNKTDPEMAYRLTQLTFALGFVTRPIGGVFFGHYGDRIGRRRMLVISLCLMGLATVSMGLIPTYRQIGIWSPILLVLLRCLQGFALGGEWGGAVLMAYEFGGKDQQGFFTAIPQIGLALGKALSAGTVAALTQLPGTQFEDWGWRLAFLFSAVLVGLGIFVRTSIHETPRFQKVVEKRKVLKIPLIEVLKNHPRNIILGLGAMWIDGAMFNVVGMWGIKYLVKNLKVPKTHVLSSLSVAGALSTFMLPLAGKLSDRYGRKKVYCIGCLTAAISSYFALSMFEIVASTNPPKIWLLYLTNFISLAFLYPLNLGTFPALFADLFDTPMRYSGMSFVYQLSRIYAGGLTPMICNDLYHANGKKTTRPIMYYTLAVGLFSALCTSLIKYPERKGGVEVGEEKTIIIMEGEDSGSKGEDVEEGKVEGGDGSVVEVEMVR